jgi:hypothetical protein
VAGNSLNVTVSADTTQPAAQLAVANSNVRAFGSEVRKAAHPDAVVN